MSDYVGIPSVKVVLRKRSFQYVSPLSDQDITLSHFYTDYSDPNIEADNVFYLKELGAVMVKPLFVNRSNYIDSAVAPKYYYSETATEPPPDIPVTDLENLINDLLTGAGFRPKNVPSYLIPTTDSPKYAYYVDVPEGAPPETQEEIERRVFVLKKTFHQAWSKLGTAPTNTQPEKPLAEFLNEAKFGNNYVPPSVANNPTTKGPVIDKADWKDVEEIWNSEEQGHKYEGCDFGNVFQEPSSSSEKLVSWIHQFNSHPNIEWFLVQKGNNFTNQSFWIDVYKEKTVVMDAKDKFNGSRYFRYGGRELRAYFGVRIGWNDPRNGEFVDGIDIANSDLYGPYDIIFPIDGYPFIWDHGSLNEEEKIKNLESKDGIKVDFHGHIMDTMTDSSWILPDDLGDSYGKFRLHFFYVRGKLSIFSSITTTPWIVPQNFGKVTKETEEKYRNFHIPPGKVCIMGRGFKFRMSYNPLEFNIYSLGEKRVPTAKMISKPIQERRDFPNGKKGGLFDLSYALKGAKGDPEQFSFHNFLVVPNANEDGGFSYGMDIVDTSYVGGGLKTGLVYDKSTPLARAAADDAQAAADIAQAEANELASIAAWDKDAAEKLRAVADALFEIMSNAGAEDLEAAIEAYEKADTAALTAERKSEDSAAEAEAAQEAADEAQALADEAAKEAEGTLRNRTGYNGGGVGGRSSKSYTSMMIPVDGMNPHSQSFNPNNEEKALVYTKTRAPEPEDRTAAFTKVGVENGFFRSTTINNSNRILEVGLNCKEPKFGLYTSETSARFASPIIWRLKAKHYTPTPPPGTDIDITSLVTNINIESTANDFYTVRQTARLEVILPKTPLIPDFAHNLAPAYQSREELIKLLSGGGREIQISLGWMYNQYQTSDVNKQVVFTGITSSVPSKETYALDIITLECKDRIQLIENNYFINSPMYDGMNLSDVFMHIATFTGLPREFFKVTSNRAYNEILEMGYSFMEPAIRFDDGTSLYEAMKSISERWWHVIRTNKNGTIELTDLNTNGSTRANVDAQQTIIDTLPLSKSTYKFYIDGSDPQANPYNRIYDTITIDKNFEDRVTQIVAHAIDRRDFARLWDGSSVDVGGVENPDSPDFLGYVKPFFHAESSFGTREKTQYHKANLESHMFQSPVNVSFMTYGRPTLRVFDIIEVVFPDSSDNAYFGLFNPEGGHSMTLAGSMKFRVMSVSTDVNMTSEMQYTVNISATHL